VEAHATDTPLDCAGLDSAYFTPFCHLTRDKAGALMQQRLSELGLTVTRPPPGAERYPTSNVIAELPGLTQPNEVVLVGAHFDAYYSGADDNSTGVAAVLELARVLSAHRFDHTVRFVGFDLEELGYLGSQRMVDALPGEKPVLSIVFDCLGYYRTEPGSQAPQPGLPTPDTADFLAVIGNEASRTAASEAFVIGRELQRLPLVSGSAPGDGATPVTGLLLRSDHTAFWLADERALLVTDTAQTW